MAGKASLFAVSSKPAASDDEDDYSDDALPADDEAEPTDDMGGGPFDAYAETIFDEKADTATKADALRQAILTIIEEQGSAGGPSVGGVLGKLPMGGMGGG